MDFFTQEGDETRLKNARLADDMDLIYSRHHIGPWGPELVAVPMRSGAHVCWYCHEMFGRIDGPKGPVEIRHGYVLLLLHRDCVGKKPRSFQTVFDTVRGHQLRRAATQIVKGSGALDEARGESASPLSLDSELFASARKLLERCAEPLPTPAPQEDVTDGEPQGNEPLIHLAEGIDAIIPRENAENTDTNNNDNGPH